MDWQYAQRAQRLQASFIRDLLKVTTRPEVISFAGGLPAAESFPLDRIRSAFDAVLAREGRKALQYGPSDGYLPLREHIAYRLSTTDSVIHPEQVLIVSGSQQALDLLGKVLLDEESRVLVETPTYLGALQAFSLYSMSFAGIECDGDGIDPEAVARAAGPADGARLLYVQPTFQNPTGRTMPAGRRAQLVEACARLRLPLVEDNPYSDLGFRGQAYPRLLNMHPDGVIYLGSFSKSLSPGMRLGYVVAPRPLVRKLEQAKQAADLHTSQVTQMVVHEVMKDGFGEIYLPRIQSVYAERCRMMLQALEEFFPGEVKWTRPEGGMFIWVSLPAGLDSVALLDDALRENLAFVPGAAFYAGQPAHHTLRLSFATEGPARMREGIAKLGSLIRRKLEQGARQTGLVPAGK